MLRVEPAAVGGGGRLRQVMEQHGAVVTMQR